MASSTRLSDLCEQIVDCPHSTPLWTDYGAIVLRSQNIKNGRLDLSAPSYTDDEHFQARTRRAVPSEGDLVITREAPMGEVCIIPPGVECCLGQRMVLLRPNRAKVDSRFLLFALQSNSVRHEIFVNEGTGSTVSNLRIPLLEALPIPTPALAEQRAIAHILGTLDDKIELNRKMNETLEAMARALFQSWFVDFDPVRAKAEGRPTGLPDSIAALFPNSFQNSELGPIPTGWTVGSLADVALLNPESWAKNTRPDIIRYVDLANTKWGKIEAIASYSKTEAPSRAQRILRCGDTIVGTVRPGNGSYALIAEDGLTGSTGFAVLRPQTSEHREFIYLTATAPENIESLAHVADGGAYPAVRPEVVIAKKVVMPPETVIAHFSKLTEPWVSRLAQGNRESQNLAVLRDTLLPKLISGEIRMGAAESLVERL